MTYGMNFLINFKASVVASVKFGNGKIVHPILYWTCDDFAMLGLKLIHVSKMVPLMLDQKSLKLI